jgi:hypothetical protein
MWLKGFVFVAKYAACAGTPPGGCGSAASDRAGVALSGPFDNRPGSPVMAKRRRRNRIGRQAAIEVRPR